MPVLARDLAEKHVIAVGPKASLLDVHRLFVEEEISGAPVVSEDEELVGVITSTDLLRAVEEERDTIEVHSAYFREILPYSSPDWAALPEDFQDRLSGRTVEDVMTRSVITVGPDDSAAAVARALRDNRVHRVFVVDRSQLVGVISAFDLLRLVEQGEVPAAAAPAGNPARQIPVRKRAAAKPKNKTAKRRAGRTRAKPKRRR
jgi:CBS domain-containing protein